MRKLISYLIVFISSLFITQATFAAGLSIRLEEPKTPTNQTEFDITFVTLDLTGRDVTVKCYKKGPSDSDFVMFGSTQTFVDGGNTGVCPITSSILNAKGTYTFKATATADAETVEDSVSVVYNNEGPGDPTGYLKERINTCDYKIKFHSADDGGKTIKVEVYRSENKTFTADSGSRVDTIILGSNTDGQSITTPPTCSKEYYFAIRAFDNAGNGSNIVGDSEISVTTTTTTTLTTTTIPGAILLETPSAGSVLGNETTNATEEGKVLGEETGTTNKPSLGASIKNNGILILGVSLLIIGLIGLYVSKKKIKQQPQ